MRMESYSPKRSNRGWLILSVLLVAGAGIYYFVIRDTPATPDAATAQAPDVDNTSHTPGPVVDDGSGTDGQSPQQQPATPTYDYRRIEGMTPELAAGIGPSPLTIQPISAAEARQAFEQGLAAYQGEKLLEARTLLNRAYTYGTLPPAQADKARELLSDLANRTILRADTYMNPKDPYLVSYTFKMGERLGSGRDRRTRMVTTPGIIARLELNTPAQIIVMANGLQNGTQFRAGKAYKMIKGPFHLVVDLSEFAADLYVQDLFLRRMPVCIGSAETPTPTGIFRIPAWSGKTPRSTYYPPVDSGLPNVAILPDEPGYPLGPKGLNIKLEGIRQLGTEITVNQGYALHGTNEPNSLGTAASRGCIRFGADDINLIYASLMDYVDPEDRTINWTRYSTVTIKK